MRTAIFKHLALMAVLSVLLPGSALSRDAASADSDDTFAVLSQQEVRLTVKDMLKRGEGTTNEVNSSQVISASTNNNSLNVGGDLTNGDISVGDNFGSGWGSYVFNSGNNSTINSAVSINVQMTSSP